MAKNKQRSQQARKARKERDTRRARARNGSRGSAQTAPMPGQPIELVFGDADDCSCPICLRQAISGTPRYTMDAGGNLVALPPLEVPETFTVTVRGQGSIDQYLPGAGTEVTLAFGCAVGELLEYLGFRQPTIWDAFEALGASRDGEACALDEVVCVGQVIDVEGIVALDPFASYGAGRAAC